MLWCFGFSDRWISLIKWAIHGSWLSVLVNGVSHWFFQSQSGLRQGDPLSPCLFIIAAKFLSRDLDQLYSQYPSLRYNTAAPLCLSHLSFVNDIIIFVNGCRSSLHHLMNFLHHYKTVSGQLINQSKSSFYVRGQTSVSCKIIVRSITGFQPRQFPFTYLGCAVYVGGVRIRHFDDMIRKIRGRISGWANRLLSFGGKLVLIRHVLSSMSLHFFQVLRLPATVI